MQNMTSSQEWKWNKAGRKLNTVNFEIRKHMTIKVYEKSVINQQSKLIRKSRSCIFAIMVYNILKLDLFQFNFLSSSIIPKDPNILYLFVFGLIDTIAHTYNVQLPLIHFVLQHLPFIGLLRRYSKEKLEISVKHDANNKGKELKILPILP